MPIDSRAFRQTIGQFATGVTVIATQVDGGIQGMTANAFTSVSLDPPLVLFCVGKTSRMGAAIRTASGFSVNILCDRQQDLSNYFAGAWKHSDPPPFAWVSWHGGPRLEGCTAALGCQVEMTYEGGDHWIVVGKVLALYRNEELSTPLVFCGGRYTTLAASDP